MMIEINLLPGARKPVRTVGAGAGVGAAVAGIAAQIKDGFLIFGLVGLVVGLGVVGFLWSRAATREADLQARVEQAVADSTRFAAVIAELNRTRAHADSVRRQLHIIRAIDGDRYTWAHLLDEISEALPPFTWLTTIQQTSAVVPVYVLDSLSKVGASSNQDLAALMAADSAYRLHVRVIGQTVDFQALTRFMRMLEASPFVENVRLFGSRLQQVEGRDVTEFTLDMFAEVPESTAVRRVPLTVAVR